MLTLFTMSMHTSYSPCNKNRYANLNLERFRVVGTNMEMISDQAKINKTGIMILEEIFSAPCEQRT